MPRGARRVPGPHLVGGGGWGGSSGEVVPADTVVFCTGPQGQPAFPFLPDHMRAQLEGREDGCQLYRHCVLPSRPDLLFVGMNRSSYGHTACIALSALWAAAYWQGRLTLPSRAEMEAAIEAVVAWKREHWLPSPYQNLAVGATGQQYLDVMCRDLGLTPYRKSNPVAEVLGRYAPEDYQGCVEEWFAVQRRRGKAKARSWGRAAKATPTVELPY